MTDLCCSIEAAHCMTCGMQATTNRQRGMTSKASVNDGDSPNWMFCTSTFSKICFGDSYRLKS